MSSDLVISIIRDLTGKAVGGVLGLVAAAGVVVPADLSDRLTVVLAAAVLVAVQVVYYVAVRWAEARWPIVGRLLGAARPPNYGITMPIYLKTVIDREATMAEAERIHTDVQTRVNDVTWRKSVGLDG